MAGFVESESPTPGSDELGQVVVHPSAAGCEVNSCRSPSTPMKLTCWLLSLPQ